MQPKHGMVKIHPFSKSNAVVASYEPVLNQPSTNRSMPHLPLAEATLKFHQARLCAHVSVRLPHSRPMLQLQFYLRMNGKGTQRTKGLVNPIYDIVDVWPSDYGVPSVRIHHRRWLIESGAGLAQSNDAAESEEDKQKQFVRLESRCSMKTQAVATSLLASSVFEMETEK
jgi:hypothetical protein